MHVVGYMTKSVKACTSWASVIVHIDPHETMAVGCTHMWSALKHACQGNSWHLNGSRATHDSVLTASHHCVL
jgi:hypothetical protein